jgi:hypothetical protein
MNAVVADTTGQVPVALADDLCGVSVNVVAAST